MKKTVLQYVQSCLSTMDSDAVDSISDTVESQQVADLLADLYQELMTRQDWAFLSSPVTMVASATPTTPTEFTIPDTLRSLTTLWYNVDEDGGLDNKEIRYVEPEEFLRRTGGAGSNRLLVTAGTQIRFYVSTDRHPSIFTSFDNNTIVLDAYKLTLSTTLELSRVSGLGIINPAFTVSDGFIPLLPDHMVPLLQHTLNASAHLHLKQQQSPVDERRVNRQLSQARRKDNKLSRKHYYANAFGRR